MSFHDLPNELILHVTEFIDNTQDILSFLRVNKHFSQLLQDSLLRFNIRHQRSTALLWASFKNQFAKASRLVSLGADVNTTAPSDFRNRYRGNVYDGDTSLHLAVRNNNVAIVELLLSNGADPEQWNNDGEMPAGSAWPEHDEEMMHAVLHHMFDVDVGVIRPIGTDCYWNALHLACLHDDLRCVQSALEAGANPNARTGRGFTPLHLAITRADYEYSDHSLCSDYIQRRSWDLTLRIVELLLQSGAELDAEADCKACTHHPDPRIRAFFNGQ